MSETGKATAGGFKRPLLFALGLVLVGVVSAGVGSLFEPADVETEPAHAGMAERDGHGAGDGHADGGSHAEEGDSHAGGSHGAEAPRGLAVAEDGYTLEAARTSFASGEPSELRFAIVGRDGEPVRRFDLAHERRMHLIVVRRDGTGFQHLHPELGADGTWRTPISFAAPGTYRAFADFSLGGEPLTLGRDLEVSGGGFEARPFPAPEPVAATGPYAVELHAGRLSAGAASSLGFAVSEGGEPVTDLEPYLGARGHLVALREGDLAYLHVHPVEGHDGEIAFAAAFPSAGRYRLYLQFKHRGEVRTAEHTVEVGR